VKYYEIVLLRSSAPNLTYYSQDKLPVGTVVTVPLKSTTKETIFIAEA